jgi:hypothetical protein
MSVRNFARVFREEPHETPSQFVERVRTTSARRLMDSTNKSLDEIAELLLCLRDRTARGVPPPVQADAVAAPGDAHDVNATAKWTVADFPRAS